MSGHTVLIAGAGFSRPFGGPLLRDLLSAEVRAASRASPDALSALRSFVISSGEGGAPSSLEEAFTRILEEQFTGRIFNIDGEPWEARELLRELRLHLGSVTARIRLDYRRAAAGLLEEYIVRLAKDSRSLTIITFNYDTLIEQCLEHGDLVYSYGPRKVISFTDRAKEKQLDKYTPDAEVLKLHGSVNWGICRDCVEAPVGSDLINALAGDYVPPRNVSCQFCDKHYLVPSIVPPVLTKGLALQSFEAIWGRARKAVSRAREVVIIGYSLPEKDTQAVSLLSSIEAPFKRPRIQVVCGAAGAPPSYGKVFSRFADLKQPFEDFLADENS